MPYIGQRPATGEANSFKILDDISNYTLTFGSSDVDVSADTITAREHRFVTGQRVTYGNGGGTDPTGLSDGTVYYIIVEDRHTFKLATSASNAVAGTAINITAAGAGAAHTINVTFDGVNTKFKATHSNGTKADISQSGQLMVSVNGVLQQPHDNTTTPTTGYATDHTSTIIFSAAPAAGDQFFGRLIASNFATFDISDNTVDNFTGDGSTSTFTLSKTPPNNESILVTIDGVVQYPDDNAAVRAYTVSENVLDFASAPGNGVEIQVRHIGFAGASTGGISGFYGRTGNAVLKNTDDIVFRNANVGVVTATDIRVTGNLTVDGTTTTLDTDLIGVDKLEVAANNTTVAAAITQTGSGDILNLYDGSTEVVSVLDGGAVRIGGNAVLGAAAGVVLQDGTGVIATRSSGSSPVFRGYTQGDNSANFTVRADGKLLLGTETAGINGAHNLTIGESGHGGITIRTGTTSAGAIYFADSTSGDSQFDGFIQYNQQTRYLRFGTAQAEQVRITSGGLVGIGTDIPESNSRLHTFTTQTTARTITETSVAAGYAGYRLTNGTGYWEMQIDGSNQGLRFLDDGTERLRIASDGKIVTSGGAAVGTVTLAGDGKDMVFGRTQNSGTGGVGRLVATGNIVYLQAGANASSGSAADLVFGNYGGVGERLRIDSDGRLLAGGAVAANAWAGGDDLIIGNATSGTRSGITLVSGSNTDGGLYWSDGNSGTALFQGQLVYNHSNSRMQFYTAGSARVTIDGSGRLLIGRVDVLASSSERLTVDSGMAMFRNNSNNAAAVYIRNEDTTASTRQPYLFFTDGGGNRGGFGVQYDESSLWIAGQGGIAFRTNGSAPSQTERLRITSGGVKQVLNGNLNIYQTYIDFSGDQSSTPQTAVALYRPADGTFAISTQNTERFRIASNGQVLIGNYATHSSIHGNLEVNGNDGINISNSYRTGTNGVQWRLIPHNGGAGQSPSNLRLYESTGGTEVINITKTGRIGVNRMTPSFMLDIVGNSSTGANCIRIVDGAETGHGSHPAKIVAGGTYYQEMQMHARRFAVHTYDGSNIAEKFRVHQDGEVLISNTTNRFLSFDRTNASSGSGEFNINVESNSQATISYDDGSQIVMGTSSSPRTQAGFSEKLRIDSNGNVAIGLGGNGAEARLHVEENLSHSSTYYLNADAHILVDNPGSGKSIIKLEGEAALVYGGGGNKLFVADRQNERFRINEYGNTIFQGAASPNNGNTGNAAILVRGKTVDGSSSTVDLNISMASSTNGIGLEINEYSNQPNALATLVFNHGSLKSMIACSRVVTNNWGTDLRFYTHDDSTSSSNQHKTYERMRIDSSGRVAINRTSPSEILHMAGAIRQDGSGNNVQYRQACYSFGSGTHTLFTLSGNGVDATAMAVFEFVCLYAYAGTNHCAGIDYASTRRSSNNTAWQNTNNQNVAVSGNDTSIVPNLFWDNGVLKITVNTSVQCTGTLRLTTRRFSVARNYSAG